MKFASSISGFWVAVLLALFATARVNAQEKKGFLLQDLNPQSPAQPGDPVTFSADFLLNDDERTGLLRVTAKVEPGWHIFSVTQPPEGPIRTEIWLEDGYTDVKVAGDFQPDSDPHKVEYEYFDVPSEEHQGTVVWSAPVEFSEGVDVRELEIPVRVKAQVCENEGGVCLQFDPSFTARAAVADTSFSLKIRPEEGHATIAGWVDKTHAQPGERIELTIQVTPDEGWWIPRYEEEASPFLNPTLVVFTRRNEARVLKPTDSSASVTVKRGTVDWRVHKYGAEWTFPVVLPGNLENQPWSFTGWIGYQPLSSDPDVADSPPRAVQFSFVVDVGKSTVTARNPLAFMIPDGADYGKVATLVQKEFERSRKNAGELAGYPVAAVLGFAFLAGLILNIMPCVLPVIGIKVLSLVQQAGENPRRALMLNLVFSAGIISIFLLLAAFSTFPQLLGKTIGWGGLFESQAFVIAMVTIVFAFALSFLGVWEIPIPGFVAAAGAGKSAQKEGMTGAFLKGVLTTLLATPCSGPLLIPVVTWGTAQPPTLTFMTFFAMGVGMAFPFILIGFQPRLVAWLPRPGAWMETFKQLMGFVLIGAAVFFFNPVTERYKLPVLAFLVFVGMGCWMAGRISFIDPFTVRARKWAAAAGVVLAGAFVAFYMMVPQHELNWQDFSRTLVNEKVAEGHVVFVDFTAHW